MTFVDNHKVKNRANFQLFVTSTFAKKAKNDFAIGGWSDLDEKHQKMMM